MVIAAGIFYDKNEKILSQQMSVGDGAWFYLQLISLKAETQFREY